MKFKSRVWQELGGSACISDTCLLIDVAARDRCDQMSVEALHRRNSHVGDSTGVNMAVKRSWGASEESRGPRARLSRCASSNASCSSVSDSQEDCVYHIEEGQGGELVARPSYPGREFSDHRYGCARQARAGRRVADSGSERSARAGRGAYLMCQRMARRASSRAWSRARGGAHGPALQHVSPVATRSGLAQLCLLLQERRRRRRCAWGRVVDDAPHRAPARRRRLDGWRAAPRAGRTREAAARAQPSGLPSGPTRRPPWRHPLPTRHPDSATGSRRRRRRRRRSRHLAARSRGAAGPQLGDLPGEVVALNQPRGRELALLAKLRVGGAAQLLERRVMLRVVCHAVALAAGLQIGDAPLVPPLETERGRRGAPRRHAAR